MLKVTLPYIVQVLRVIVSKLPREPSVQKVVLEFERTMWSATREVLSGVQITQCTFHFHPTLAGPILDLKRDPAEFFLISQIVRQVWWVRAIARPAPGQLKLRARNEIWSTVFILTYSCISVVRPKNCVTFFGSSGCSFNFSKIFWLPNFWFGLLCDLGLT